jgi:hypothetical protein
MLLVFVSEAEFDFSIAHGYGLTTYTNSLAEGSRSQIDADNRRQYFGKHCIVGSGVQDCISKSRVQRADDSHSDKGTWTNPAPV